MNAKRLKTPTTIAAAALFAVALIASVATILAPPSLFRGFGGEARGFLVIMLWLVFLLVLQAAIASYYLAWMSHQSRLSGQGSAGDPLAILSRRYAQGEIGREEWKRIWQDLEEASES